MGTSESESVAKWKNLLGAINDGRLVGMVAPHSVFLSVVTLAVLQGHWRCGLRGLQRLTIIQQNIIARSEATVESGTDVVLYIACAIGLCSSKNVFACVRPNQWIFIGLKTMAMLASHVAYRWDLCLALKFPRVGNPQTQFVGDRTHE